MHCYKQLKVICFSSHSLHYIWVCCFFLLKLTSTGIGFVTFSGALFISVSATKDPAVTKKKDKLIRSKKLKDVWISFFFFSSKIPIHQNSLHQKMCTSLDCLWEDQYMYKHPNNKVPQKINIKIKQFLKTTTLNTAKFYAILAIYLSSTQQGTLKPTFLGERTSL